MLRGYNLVPWKKITLHIEEANQLLKDHYTYGWILQAYLFTPRTCPQTRDWHDFVDLGLNYYLRCSRIDLTKIKWENSCVVIKKLYSIH
jgi:hypothetical protein